MTGQGACNKPGFLWRGGFFLCGFGLAPPPELIQEVALFSHKCGRKSDGKCAELKAPARDVRLPGESEKKRAARSPRAIKARRGIQGIQNIRSSPCIGFCTKQPAMKHERKLPRSGIAAERRVLIIQVSVGRWTITGAVKIGARTVSTLLLSPSPPWDFPLRE